MALPSIVAPTGSSRETASAVDDLPHPDSPTIASVWPGATANETPRTAWRSP